MPTVIREGGFEVRMFYDDHPPPHAHVVKAGAEVRVNLLTAWAMKIKGKVSRSDMRKAERLVLKHRETLLKIWEELHG
jgi:Domain of unknown function (DUF4160)